MSAAAGGLVGTVGYAFVTNVYATGAVNTTGYQSPYAGGAPLEIDDAHARTMPGITDVVKLPEGVGVIRVLGAFRAERDLG